MGRKKQKKDKDASSDRPGGGSKNTKMAAGIVLAIMIVLSGVYFTTKQESSVPSGPPAEAFGKLIETKPVLNHKMFSGKAQLAYKIAAEIPKVIDSQFCYCYCKRDHGHKTLLTCFTNDHGSKCDLCMAEVFYAYDLYKEGKSADEIVKLVDKKFYRPYRGHRL